MKRILRITFIINSIFWLSSCHVGTYGTWVNTNIDPSVKAEIDGLNKKLFADILAKDISAVKQLSSPGLVEKVGKRLDTIVNSGKDMLNATSYEILDEYYTKSSTSGISNHLISSRGDHNDYKIDYQAINKEMYVSLLIAKNASLDHLILAVYGKYDDGWKLNILHFGEYRIFNKTAPDYYNLAKNEYDKGNLINAMDKISMSYTLARPLSDFFQYNIEGDMKETYSKIIKECNDKYHLPQAINQISTRPQIFSIAPQYISNGDIQGIFPIIRYQSKINLDDTVALKAENKSIQNIAGALFKGIDNNHVIFYQAFNQIPNGKTMVTHYGFIQRLK